MKILDRKLGEQQYYKISNKAFVVAADNSDSVAIIVETTKRDEVLNFVTHAQANLKDGAIVFKVIGPAAVVNPVSTILSNSTSCEIKSVPRSGDYEVFYFSHTGRIRLSKQVGSTVSAIAGNIKVLVVDDSKTIRNLLKRVIERADGIEVVAMAEKPSEVEELIKKHKPDVITLDIHMPEMTGVDLLKIIAPKYNIPTIMITSISIEEGPLVLDALENGAFDYIQKPQASELAEVAPMLSAKLKEAALSKKTAGKINKIGVKPVEQFNQDSLIVIGSSTGGTNALKDIMTKLPAQIPPMLIVQHIPPVFSKAFADRLNKLCPFSVSEAKDGDLVKQNTVYVAPGGQQMKIVNHGGTLKVKLTDDSPVNRFKPSVDYLFESVIPLVKRRHVVSVILTGMGKDGAAQMLNLRKAGAYTIAQDEESCVVFGMPKEAINLGGAMAIEHKDDIAAKMAELSWQKKKHNEAG